MQTFLPYPSYIDSAKVLDRQRLGKQRVECLQILNVLHNKTKKQGWKNHPAVKMWKGYEQSLCDYTIAICDEWIRRGYKDRIKDRVMLEYWDYSMTEDFIHSKYHFKELLMSRTPPFVSNMDFHLSHQSNLIRKDPEYYKPIFGNIPDSLEYIWIY